MLNLLADSYFNSNGFQMTEKVLVNIQSFFNLVFSSLMRTPSSL